jgi:hypothetical protein
VSRWFSDNFIAVERFYSPTLFDSRMQSRRPARLGLAPAVLLVAVLLTSLLGAPGSAFQASAVTPVGRAGIGPAAVPAASPPAVHPAAPGPSGPAAPAVDGYGTQWPTLLHDGQRTGANPDERTLDPSNASHLQQLWMFNTTGAVTGSLAVVNGTAFFGSWNGYLYAVNA